MNDTETVVIGIIRQLIRVKLTPYIICHSQLLSYAALSVNQHTRRRIDGYHIVVSVDDISAKSSQPFALIRSGWRLKDDIIRLRDAPGGASNHFTIDHGNAGFDQFLH